MSTNQNIVRPYQAKFEADIQAPWASGARNVLGVLPTGAGKTFVFSHIIKTAGCPCIAIAHRQELVYQISLALARWGVRHRIIGPSSVIRFAVAQHMREIGRSFVDDRAPHAVAGVDTLVRRVDELRDWSPRVGLWVTDEAHHVASGNKWQRAVAMFPNARGLGVSATPVRADGAGLGRHANGVFDALVVGPTMREIIRLGYLTDYRIFAPASDLDLSTVAVGGSGDYVREQLRGAVRRSHIVGDIVQHYQRIAPGRLGVTFVPDTDTAAEVADAYNAAGVPAAVVTHKTNDIVRAYLIEQFRNRELMQLVNVDLFGEGFDLPAIEVVSFGRPTQSYALYAQQFGRALRIMDGKREAIIIDHVRNVERHGLPDGPRTWTLDARERRAKADPDMIPTRVCPECTLVYERVHTACPYCGYYAPPSVRNGPEHVDGDLTELDAATLARMRGEVDAIDMTVGEFAVSLHQRHVPTIGHPRMIRNHEAAQVAQVSLRAAIAQWAGVWRDRGATDAESYRRFYFRYSTDVLTAQTLGANDAADLTARIARDTEAYG
jgi:superfamily II DNA or RNA helicase